MLRLARDSRFAQARFGEVGGAQFCVDIEKKFGELGRRDRCSGKHGIHLPTMMDLMLEHMFEQPRTRFLLFCARTQKGHLAREGVVGEVRAVIDEPPVRQ